MCSCGNHDAHPIAENRQATIEASRAVELHPNAIVGRGRPSLYGQW